MVFNGSRLWTMFLLAAFAAGDASLFTPSCLAEGAAIDGAEQRKREEIEIGNLKGHWSIASQTLNGKSTDLPAGSHRWSFQENTVHVQWNVGKRGAESAKGQNYGFTVNPSKSPAQINLFGDGVLIQAVYELKGETLTICHFGRPEIDRPTGFEMDEATRGDRPLIVRTFKREVESSAGTTSEVGSERISAPLVYKDLMLIVSGSQGIAAIVFPKSIESGVEYRFRYESNDGKEHRTGNGKVFELRENGAIGGELTINAGPIQLEWSLGDENKGWIYYSPEEFSVQIANARQFDLSLSRFRKN